MFNLRWANDLTKTWQPLFFSTSSPMKYCKLERVLHLSSRWFRVYHRSMKHHIFAYYTHHVQRAKLGPFGTAGLRRLGYIAPTSNTVSTQPLRGRRSSTSVRRSRVWHGETRLRLTVGMGYAVNTVSNRQSSHVFHRAKLGLTSRRTPCQPRPHVFELGYAVKTCGPAGTDLWHGGGRTACQRYAVVRHSH